MPLVPEGAIQIIRGLKQDDYSDQAIRLVYTRVASGNSYGKPSYPPGASFSCRVVEGNDEDALPGANVEQADAEVFYDLGVTLLSDDRVQITHLHGDLVTARDYDIVAGPYRSNVGQSAKLKLVKGP